MLQVDGSIHNFPIHKNKITEMSTYSLTLRESIGRKLTIGELDNNFLYLEDLFLHHKVKDLLLTWIKRLWFNPRNKLIS